MTRALRSAYSAYPAAFLLVCAAVVSACNGNSTQAAAAAPAEPAAVAVRTAQVQKQAIDRFLRVTGSLAADEQAGVAAETAGRVTGTPVERGTHVTQGAVLVRLSATEADASLREAEANAAQLEARLGLEDGQPFDPSCVPEVLNAKAALDWAEADFNRIKSLLAQKVVSQAEYDQKLTAVNASRQQFLAAQNTAQQSYRSLQAARARIDLARKTAADTVVRAPFTGIVSERLVTTGDYVNKGMKVATVVRIDPVRVELTVPEQYVSLVKAGQAVRLSVDAYPNETFTANVKFVSPALKTDQRALTVEAVAPNADGRLKPGLFATAFLQQTSPAPALLVPASAVETMAGTSRVYVITTSNTVEERIVTLGETVGERVELASGVKAGERVAANPRGKLA
ncbi:MAG TPA: efflux RND transporter periplasmic adaptor subunit, partial [Vicinamibacterales bacterium]|nr:efflux RND transporter periplasmic adaptor subunit [Vicinamibacterales bacterium]